MISPVLCLLEITELQNRGERPRIRALIRPVLAGVLPYHIPTPQTAQNAHTRQKKCHVGIRLDSGRAATDHADTAQGPQRTRPCSDRIARCRALGFDASSERAQSM
jgi:hypothetical protein